MGKTWPIRIVNHITCRQKTKNNFIKEYSILCHNSDIQMCRFILSKKHKHKTSVACKDKKQDRTYLGSAMKIVVKYQGGKIHGWGKFLHQILPSCTRYLISIEDLSWINCQLAGSEIYKYVEWSFLPSSSKDT